MLLLTVEGGADPAGVEAVYAPLGASWSGHPAVRRYPLSSEYLALPADGRSVVPRIGLGLMGELTYGPEGFDGFEPRLFTAMDLPLLAKGEPDEPIVARLNWGEQSIGVSDQLQFVDRFDALGVLGRVRLAGWYERDGDWWPLGEDTAAKDLGLSCDKLSAYLVFAVNSQVAGEGWMSPGQAMAAGERPSHGLVCVATLPAGKGGKSPVVVKPGDVVHAVAYDAQTIEPGEVLATLKQGGLKREGVSILSRRVVEAE